MPVINVTLVEDYDEATRQKLSQQLVNIVGSITGAGPEGVSVEIGKFADTNLAHANQREISAITSASTLVRLYLTTMESRDLDKAKGFLAKDFQMTFPGGVTFRTPEELAAWGKSRYRFVEKNYECFDEIPIDTGAIVYCFGTLSGAMPDGTRFNGIRFIDRFVVSGDKLIDQQVWNDLAETLVSE